MLAYCSAHGRRLNSICRKLRPAGSTPCSYCCAKGSSSTGSSGAGCGHALCALGDLASSSSFWLHITSVTAAVWTFGSSLATLACPQASLCVWRRLLADCACRNNYTFDPFPDLPADFGPEVPDDGIDGLLRVSTAICSNNIVQLRLAGNSPTQAVV
jgi:hypothetical protein